MNHAQILKDCFDTTRNALRVSVGATGTTTGGFINYERALKLCYDPVKHALIISDPGISVANGSKLDPNQIFKRIFDTTNGRIKAVTVV